MAATAGNLELIIISVTDNPDSRSVQYSRSDTGAAEYFAADPNATDEEVVAQLQAVADSLFFQNTQDAALFSTTYTATSGTHSVTLTVVGSASHADSNTIKYKRSDTEAVEDMATANVADDAVSIGTQLQDRAQAIADAIDSLVGTVVSAQ